MLVENSHLIPCVCGGKSRGFENQFGEHTYMEDGEKLKLPGTWGLGGVYLRRKDSGLALPIKGNMCQ